MSHFVEIKADNYKNMFIVKFQQNHRKGSILRRCVSFCVQYILYSFANRISCTLNALFLCFIILIFFHIGTLLGNRGTLLCTTFLNIYMTHE